MNVIKAVKSNPIMLEKLPQQKFAHPKTVVSAIKNTEAETKEIKNQFKELEEEIRKIEQALNVEQQNIVEQE
jgi:hypothetical protein